MDEERYYVLFWDGDNHEWYSDLIIFNSLEEVQREFRFQLAYPGTVKKNLKIVKEVPYDV